MAQLNIAHCQAHIGGWAMADEAESGAVHWLGILDLTDFRMNKIDLYRDL